tara:strand:+ start:5786 stop:5980 length:195 start_codon:yes stop_codon:yes gene_type:complete
MVVSPSRSQFAQLFVIAMQHFLQRHDRGGLLGEPGGCRREMLLMIEQVVGVPVNQRKPCLCTAC